MAAAGAATRCENALCATTSFIAQADVKAGWRHVPIAMGYFALAARRVMSAVNVVNVVTHAPAQAAGI